VISRTPLYIRFVVDLALRFRLHSNSPFHTRAPIARDYGRAEPQPGFPRVKPQGKRATHTYQARTRCSP
jgi:hypothetical protein